MPQGFSGVGLVHSHIRTVTGGKGIGTFWGNCPQLKVDFTPNAVERNESMTTARAPYRRMTQATQGSITLVTDEFNKKNVANTLLARVDEVAAGGSVNHTWPTGAVVSDVLSTPDKNPQSVVVTDSSGSPKTLLLNVNYTLDAFSGNVKLTDLTTGGPFVQPFKAAYTKGAVSVIAGLAVPAPELWFAIAGINADSGLPFAADIYRVRVDVAKTFSWINSEYQDFELSGSLLQDSTKVANAVGGQFYSIALPSTHE
jgi:hypothetical protein